MAIKSLDKSSIVRPQTTNSMLAGYSFMDYELIESVFVASPAASVTFSNLQNYAAEYEHLQIRATIKTNHAATWEVGQIRLNNDSASNYATHALAGNGSSVVSNASASATSMAYFTAGTTTASAFGGLIIDILDAYSTSKNKTLRMFSGYGSVEVRLSSGVWLSTNSITSATLSPIFGTSISANSRFSLYGIR